MPLLEAAAVATAGKSDVASADLSIIQSNPKGWTDEYIDLVYTLI